MNLSKFRSWLQEKVVTWQGEYRQHRLAMLKSGLGYGFGLAFGILFSKLLLNMVNPEWFVSGNAALRLAIGLILAFLIFAIGAGVAGFTGGWTLPLVRRARGRVATAVLSALGMGVLFSLLVFPLVLAVGLLSFYDVAELRPRLFGFVLGLVGMLFGALLGLWLGYTTVGSGRVGRIVRPAVTGFGLGGFLLGCAIWAFLISVTQGEVYQGNWFWMLLGLFAFGGLGGGALGLAYGRLSIISDAELLIHHTFKHAVIQYWPITLILILGVFYLRPIIAAVGDMLTPSAANLASALSSETLGTHWNDPVYLPLTTGSAVPSQPALSADPSGGIALAWMQPAVSGGPGEVYVSTVARNSDGRPGTWRPAVNVSASPESDSSAPQVVIDPSGVVYVAWVEELASGQSAIHVTRCQGDDCLAPTELSALQPDLACDWPTFSDRQLSTAPRLAINGDQLMLTWRSAGVLLYSTWSTLDVQPTLRADCLPGPKSSSDAVSLVAGPGNGFSLAYSTASDEQPIYQLNFTGTTWGAARQVAQGGDPSLYIDGSGNSHLAWCGPDGRLVYQPVQGDAQQVSTLPCQGMLALLADSQGNLHLLWASGEVVNALGVAGTGAVIYETRLDSAVWQPAALAVVGDDPAAEPIQFAAAHDSAGLLHLAWPAGGQAEGSLAYAAQVQYTCPDAPENRLSQVVYQAAVPYRSPQSPLPYCGNRYERLIFAPNPAPAFSDISPSPSGAFAKLGEPIRQARYEVLLSTMWYETDENLDSPGAVVAGAVADLYRQVKENPARYPRGMTVRILLGNPPEVVVDETGDQLSSLLNDLRNAGVMEMRDLQIGWQVEVANFKGALPHAHTKMLVIDGKDITAAGFNFEYYHYPSDHPSGLGKGRWDMAMQISGPVAQDAISAFDDLWQDSDGRRCNFHPALDIAWQATCRDYAVEAGHVPEVLKYYLPGGGAEAFSLYRNEAYPASDDQITAVVSAAQQSVDLTHVNFTLQLICDLDILYNVCNFQQALAYYDALLNAAENGAHLRILVSQVSIDGIETTLGLEILMKEAARRGVSDRIEVRFFDDWMHLKTILVDDQFLVVGSQNFHYSAFGDGTGLAEYSLGTDDPQAIADYRRFFEYQWARGTPWGK